MSTTDAPEPEWRRRQRLARIFGEVLPEQTGDDRAAGEDTGSSPDSAESPGDRWLKQQVPPHHG